jgi:predicted amino acid dehydrogenase
MKRVLVIHSGDAEFSTRVEMFGQPIELRHVGCGGEMAKAKELLAEHDGLFDVMAVEGFPVTLQLGSLERLHRDGGELLEVARHTPVVDGSAVRSALERWGVMLAERAEPGLLTDRRVLMVPALNHGGMAHALSLRNRRLRYADASVFFGLVRPPGTGKLGSPTTPSRLARTALRRLRQLPVDRFSPSREAPGEQNGTRLFRWAEVLAGDLSLIRRHAPMDLRGKTVVTEFADSEGLEDLHQRGASCVVTLMPALVPDATAARFSAATIEAVLAASRPDPAMGLTEDTYLDLISEVHWTPAVRYLQTDEAGFNRFAFVIHPLHVGMIHGSPMFRWTRYLPDTLVETLAAYLPPFRVSRITGVRSPTTGQRVEGQLIALGATPRQMMRRSHRFTYKRLSKAAKIAQRQGARIMGLGAFTSVVGDAGVTVARDAPIAITSGNSLTVAATLEAAKLAAVRMGTTDLTHGRAMVIGATGSIGSVCARMIAQAIHDVVLVSIEPERLIDLKRTIQRETPGARIAVSTRPDGLVASCDVVVTATSAFGQRILDISQCKPGAIVCDVARPPDINEDEAALRPDVLVIESGEVLIPGEVDFHYDIGLPPRVSYACLAETALLALEGRFESFTLGREISISRVKEIYGLFKKHGFRLAGLRSLGRYLSDEEIGSKRELAERLRSDPELLERTKRVAAQRLAKIPIRSKGVTDS